MHHAPSQPQDFVRQMNHVKILSVVGARPNFMKIAPFLRAIEAHNAADPELRVKSVLVHTGQHYDARMSDNFLETLGIPDPDHFLGIGSGSHAWQVGQTMIAFEKVMELERPDWVVLVGDVNATCACSITAKKQHVRVAHIEAGLRSFDLRMPEEINRLVTDRLSDLLLTTDEFADRNLRQEGVCEEKIRRVGNIMIDTLENERAAATALDIQTILKESMIDAGAGQATGCRLWRNSVDYALMTLHRPSNVDDPETLGEIVRFVRDEVVPELPVVLPVHPRTRRALETAGLWTELLRCDDLILLEPLGYREMLRLNLGASLMLTDSGGLQEECCVLGTPCLTLRENTERPVTLLENGGVSVLAGNRIDCLRREFARLRKTPPRPARPSMWDGRAAERILECLLRG